MCVENIFREMEIQVQLDDGKSIILLEKECKKNDGVIEKYYCNEENKVEVTFLLKHKNNKTFIYVKAGIDNENPLKKSSYFSPKHAVVIKIKNRQEMDGLMALYRHKQWWTRPSFHKKFANLPEKVQSLLWKEKNDYFYMIPTVSEIYKADLAGNDCGLELAISSFAGGYDKVDALVGTVAQGEDPYALCKDTINDTIEELGFRTIPREKKDYPKIFEYLGWCSWDAFYVEVNEKGVKEKINELTDLNVPVKWAIIDDGWLKVKDRALEAFEPDAEKFPDGFGSLTKYLKEKNGIEWVGVWHTLMGYWGGIHPESLLAKEMAGSLHKNNQGRMMPSPYSSKAFRFWDKWYKYLKKEGIDFVKVDGQSGINLYTRNQQSIGEAAREMHTSLEAAAGIHFNQNIINCMGMSSENIWSRPISAISRNSDDFVPGEEISFKEHALQNAYNSYYHGQFYWGDWDMFWTQHEEALQNSVLRAVSGGPIYISDRIGQTDPAYLWPLVLNNGKILRGDQPGLPTNDCLFENPNESLVPLKVWNTIGDSFAVASFNINLDNQTVSGKLSPRHLPGASMEKAYLVYDYFQQFIEKIEYNEEKEFEILENGVKLHILLPYEQAFVPIGLVDKYLSTSTIIDTYQIGNTRVVKLIQGGMFGFYSESPVKEVRIGKKAYPIEEKGENLYFVDCSHYSSEVTLGITMEM